MQRMYSMLGWRIHDEADAFIASEKPHYWQWFTDNWLDKRRILWIDWNYLKTFPGEVKSLAGEVKSCWGLLAKHFVNTTKFRFIMETNWLPMSRIKPGKKDLSAVSNLDANFGHSFQPSNPNSKHFKSFISSWTISLSIFQSFALTMQLNSCFSPSFRSTERSRLQPCLIVHCRPASPSPSFSDHSYWLNKAHSWSAESLASTPWSRLKPCVSLILHERSSSLAFSIADL
jgi:hypothetical protein